MSKKLFVGNLSYQTTEDQLHQLFAEIGEVTSARLMLDRESGRSRGFGFVEMADDAAATQAIEQLNNSEFDGRKIVVNEARPMKPREGGGGGGGFNRGGGGGKPARRW